MLVAARSANLEALRAELPGRIIDPANPRLLAYLKASMGALPDEVLRVLFLGPARDLIADEQLQNGTLGYLAIYPRTIFRRAIELDAAAIILVHNHPSGDPTPSSSDVEVTERLAAIGRALDVELIEHIVVTSCGHRSILQQRISSGPGSSARFALRDEASDWRDGSEMERALANAQRISRRRILRRQLIGADDLFGEPAWDMLIDLFIHEAEIKPVSTGSLCIASGLPMSSALRLLQRLCDAGLVIREADRHDGRRNFIRLTPRLAHRLMAYFAAGDE
ncbi:JAB domain-containing protein [Sphingopyxis sp. 550A]